MQQEENRKTVLDLPNIPNNTSRESQVMQTMLLLYETSLKKPRTFGTMKLEAMFPGVQRRNLIFPPAETYLNPQRESRCPPSWIFIRNILFILRLGAEWMEWRSVHSGIGMRNRKTRAFYILATLIPELWIKNALLVNKKPHPLSYMHCTLQ